MDIEAFFKKNSVVKKWMKWGGGVVVAIWIVREIFMMTMFHSMFNFVTGGINSQEAAMKSMEQRADEHMQNVEKGMQGVVNGIQAGAEEMNQKLEKLKKDFEKAGEVEEELKHAWDDLQKASAENTKDMFEMIDQDAKKSEKLSKEFIDSWFADYEKKEKKQRLQDKKESEAKRKKTLQETGFLLPSYEERFGSKS